METIEEPYSENIIILINKKKEECDKKTKLHDRLSIKYNNKYMIYGIIPLAIPLIMTFVSQVIEDKEDIKIASGIGFLITGLAQIMLKFLKLEEQVLTHDFASNQYNSVSNYIDATLARSEKYRIPADVVLAVIRTELKHLDTYSPPEHFDCLCSICK